jgi:hypothetical protein
MWSMRKRAWARIRRGAVAGALLLFTACSSGVKSGGANDGGVGETTTAGRAPIELGLGEVVELAPGEAAKLLAESLVVTFVGVDFDSRCPRGAVCVWVGEASVLADVRSGGTVSRHRISTREPWLDIGDGRRIAVDRVEPHPVHREPKIDPDRYRLALHFESLE